MPLMASTIHSQRTLLAGAAPCARQQARAQRRALAAAPCATAQEVESAKQVLERASAEGKGERFDGRAFRRSLNQTGRYTRKPSNDPSSLALMEEHGVGYSSTGLVAQMREAGNVWQQGEVTVELAEAYGFCWGVERAVQMAYEARKAYPNQRLHITNEIIHNPGGCTCFMRGCMCCVCWPLPPGVYLLVYIGRRGWLWGVQEALTVGCAGCGAGCSIRGLFASLCADFEN